MIVGPNGTGKSSLVNAIVLGLGGKINVIGRAKQLSAYVRRGCQTAKIQVELYSEPRNYIICRIFTVDNRNNWWINGEHVSLKQVETLIKKLNIQVDNLCQFLPQDRVQDFAKMDSKQLLENTLKTVGSTEVVELHTDLKELREEELKLGVKTNEKRKQLESEKKKIARLETEVQAIKEREETLKAVKMVEKKKAWVEFNDIEKRKKEVLLDRNKILELKKTAEKDLLPYEKEIQETKETMKLVEKSINKEIKIGGENSSAMRRKFDGVSNTDDQIHSVRNELQRKLDTEMKRTQRISSLEEEIHRLESVIDLRKEATLEKQVSQLYPQMSNKNNKISRLQNMLQELEENLSEMNRSKLRMEGMLQKELNASNKKLQILSQRFHDTYSAYEWLQKNRDQFRCNIYSPILLEISCREDVAKYVEFIIPHRDLTAFVCEDKDDMNKFMRMVRDEMGLRINVVQATQNFSRPVRENFQPRQTIESLGQFGFWSFIIDQIKGPDPVLNYLCQTYGLHQIPIGDKKTNTLQDQIPDNIRSYFSDSHHYSVRISKYSGEKSSRIVIVKPSVLLAGSTNQTLISEYTKSIMKEADKINKTKHDILEQKAAMEVAEREINELRSQKRNMDQELQSLRTGRTKLKMRKEELDAYIREGAIDPELEKVKAQKKIAELVVNVCKDQSNVNSYLKNYQDSLVRNSLFKLKLSMVQAVLVKKQQESAAASKKVEDFKRMLLNSEEKVQRAQIEYKRAHENALKLTDGLSPKDAAFKRKYEQHFASLPDSIDMLDTEISNLTARADCLAGGRISVLEEYEKTKKLIENLEKDVANPEKKLKELKDNMQRKRDIWIPKVLGLIERINNNFTTFFSLMKCVGEVSLEVPEEKSEYSKYGICIKVQFRESSRLQQLGPHTQSGGERAVATAIYMLSLQELTTVPFRCVDEINQGMDEYNERVVFKLMVSTVEKANSAQCFLLTPKILPSLDYSENVHVLCIYSGLLSLSHTELNITKTMKNARRLSDRMRRESLKRKHSDSDNSD
ncbi:structural maintenance of chromosomes protein 5 isoform X2 [Homalodisca vitripennis]|nr:structural maintenance of chromosomes protein 5 isoform X2 [Homalodisca vitripennis]